MYTVRNQVTGLFVGMARRAEDAWDLAAPSEHLRPWLQPGAAEYYAPLRHTPRGSADGGPGQPPLWQLDTQAELHGQLAELEVAYYGATEGAHM